MLGNVDICICISSDFDLQRRWETYYRAMNHSPMLWHQLDLMGRNHHSHKCAFIEKHGNMEVEIERMGGEMGHKQYQHPICSKTLHEAPNEKFEWPLP